MASNERDGQSPGTDAIPASLDRCCGFNSTGNYPRGFRDIGAPPMIDQLTVGGGRLDGGREER